MEDLHNTSNESDMEDDFIASSSEEYIHYEESESGSEEEKISNHSFSKKESISSNCAQKTYKERIKNDKQFSENSQSGPTNVRTRIFQKTNKEFNQRYNNKKKKVSIIKEDIAKHVFHEKITENRYKESIIKPIQSDSCEELETYRFPINKGQAGSKHGKSNDHSRSTEGFCELEKEEEHTQHDCIVDDEGKQTLLLKKFIGSQKQDGCRNWHKSQNNINYKVINERHHELENNTANFNENQYSSNCKTRGKKQFLETFQNHIGKHGVDQNNDDRNARQFKEKARNHNNYKKNDICHKKQFCEEVNCHHLEFCDKQDNDSKNKKQYGGMSKIQSDNENCNKNNHKHERNNEKQFFEEFRSPALEYRGNQFNQNNYGRNFRQSNGRFINQTNGWHSNRNYKKNDIEFKELQSQIVNLSDNKNNFGKQFHGTRFNNYKKGERNVQCPDEQRPKMSHYRGRKDYRPFTYRTNFDNGEYRPHSVQSNYENKGKKEFYGSHYLERPSSSQSDYVAGDRNIHYANKYCSQSTRNLSSAGIYSHQKVFSLGPGSRNNKGPEKCNRFTPKQSRGFYNHVHNHSKDTVKSEKCLGYLDSSDSSSQSNAQLKPLDTSATSSSRRKFKDQCRRGGIEKCSREETEKEKTKEDSNFDSEKEVKEESHLVTDQPFEILSVDFKSEFPLTEEEALKMNIDLNEEVKDYLLLGKEGDVVVTEEPKTLWDIARFMQMYSNATAVLIKD